jgi:hypothetical protein
MSDLLIEPVESLDGFDEVDAEMFRADSVEANTNWMS